MDLQLVRDYTSLSKSAVRSHQSKEKMVSFNVFANHSLDWSCLTLFLLYFEVKYYVITTIDFKSKNKNVNIAFCRKMQSAWS